MVPSDLHPAEGQAQERFPWSADVALLQRSSSHVYCSAALLLAWLKSQSSEDFSTNSVQTFSSSVQTWRKSHWFQYYYSGVYRLMRLKCFSGWEPKKVTSYLCVSPLLIPLSQPWTCSVKCCCDDEHTMSSGMSFASRPSASLSTQWLQQQPQPTQWHQSRK